MDLMDLVKVGAQLIQNNSDDATTGLDAGSIAGALSNILGSNTEGGFDLGSLVGNLANSSSNGELMEIVSSWVGNGENASISSDLVGELLGSEKVSEFASQLGISEESAKGALADALPQVVDQATGTEGDDSIVGNLLSQVGGVEGAMNMLSGLLKK
jgi:uncharacterized protein YidB (DUF937 family)